MEKDTIAQTKQTLGFDIFSMLLVLILPFILIFFSNSIGGTFIGIVFLAFILYGITYLYNNLYRKKLIIKTEKLIYEHRYFLQTNLKEINYSEIKNIKVEQELLSRIIGIGKLEIELNDDQKISLHNIEKPFEIEDIIKGKL